jgi:hypothetical protein
MGRIVVSALKPGMILSAPVFNVQRKCLADTDMVLDIRTINIFQAWGIVEVEVREVSEPSLQEIEDRMALSPSLQQLSAEIDERFYGSEQCPFIIELRRIAKKLAIEEQPI